MPSKTNQTPTKKTKKTPEQKRWIRKRLIIIFASLLTIALLIDITPFGGNIRFYAKWAECGQRPVQEDNSFSFGARIRSYMEPATFEPIRFGLPTYYCTPLEAEEAGLSASRHNRDFPNLEKQKLTH